MVFLPHYRRQCEKKQLELLAVYRRESFLYNGLRMKKRRVQKRMDEQKRKKIRNGISVISIFLVVLVGVFLYIFIKNPNMNPLYFYLVIGGFLLLYWILLDFGEPKLLGQFENMTRERKEAHTKYVLLDLAGYVGIAIFIFSIGTSGSLYGLAGAVVYIFTMSTKRKFREKFLEEDGPVEKEDQRGE